MRVNTRAFYAWDRPPGMTDKARERKALAIKVGYIFEGNRKVYESRRISKELKTRC
jgi:hypothetical protein